ncbi:heavy-metal-associated domain-containing protein [Streptomyces sp. NPDC050743]|uniref:heavy-metal-associated domain-containing protein n=1 Tax=Streptomyces sp. NPDC050743 TaxID=3365634 RepID=UPI0037BB094E
MDCAHCRHAVTEQIADVHNVGSVTADRSSATVTVSASRPMDHSDITAVVDEESSSSHDTVPPALHPEACRAQHIALSERHPRAHRTPGASHVAAAVRRAASRGATPVHRGHPAPHRWGRK